MKLFNLSLLSLLAAAVAASPAGAQTKKRQSVNEDGEAEASGASEAARRGKSFMVAVEPIGLTMMPVQGLRLGYLFNDDLSVEGAYATGTGELSIGDLKSKFTKNVVEVKGKYFPGNSFYIDGGLAMEMWANDYTVLNDATAGTRKTLSGSLTNLGVDFHIGNQWQWDGGFTLGVDWVGYFLSLSTSTSFDDDAAVDQADKKDAEDDLESDQGGSSFHITRLYLGWVF